MTIQCFLQRAIRRMAAQQGGAKLMSFSEISSLVLITHASREQSHSTIQWLAGKFPNLQQIRLVNFVHEKTTTSYVVRNVRLTEVNKKQFTLFGNFKKNLLLEFQKKSFDLLINCDQSSSPYMHALSAFIAADLKIGMHKHICDQLYTVCLIPPDDLDVSHYVVQVKGYLDALRGEKPMM